MFGFNRNRGIFNSYNQFNNNGPFSGYDNSARKEESFIRKYILFRIACRIFGLIFVLLILFSFFRSQNRKNNNTVINNSYNKSNIVYIKETRI